MKKRPVAIQTSPALDALREFRQKTHQPRQPKLEVRHRHPDIGAGQNVQHRKRQPENRVVRFSVGEQFVEQFGHMRQRHRPRIADLGGQRRLQHLTGIQPRQLLPLADVIKRAHIRHRLQRPAKPPLRFFRRPRHAAHFALRPRKQRDQQIGLAQRIRAQHDRFRLLECHGNQQ